MVPGHDHAAPAISLQRACLRLLAKAGRCLTNANLMVPPNGATGMLLIAGQGGQGRVGCEPDGGGGPRDD